MNTINFTGCLVLAVLLFALGCASKRKQDTLAASQGWKPPITRDLNLDKKVIVDYKAYIQRMPPNQRSQLTDGSIHFFTNANNGQHAVCFDIGRPSSFFGSSEGIYTHVLVYDQSNKRIQVVNYRSRSRLYL
jgi:hypothetical protein